MPVQRQKDFLPRRKISQTGKEAQGTDTAEESQESQEAAGRQRLLPRQIRLRRTLLMKVIR